ELGPELERREWVEERRLRHLAMRDRQRRVEEPERHAREADDAAGDLEEVRQRVAQEEQRLLRRVLAHRAAHEPRPRAVVREELLEVALEDERALLLAEEHAAKPDDALHRLARVDERLAVVLSDDRGLLRRSGVVPRVGEA